MTSQATRLTVAAMQLCSGNDIAENGRQIEDLAAEAAHRGAQLIALPENAYCMEIPGGKRTVYDEASHPGVAHACGLAARLEKWLMVGSLAVLPDGAPETAKTLNRQLLIGPDGAIFARYDKIHLFDATLPSGEVYAESARFAPGDVAVLARTPLAALGLTICYDVRFPHLYRALAQAGAQVLAVPAAFTATTGRAHWHVLLRARAIETGCFVIAPAQSGTHPGGRQTYGRALIVSPWGEVIADAQEGPGMALATLDLTQVEAARARITSLALNVPIEVTSIC